MSMTEQGMADVVIAKLQAAPPSTAADAQTLWASGLKEYIESNFTATCSWSAVDVHGTPDPVTSFPATISFSSFSLYPVANLPAWMSLIVTRIVAGNITNSSWSISTLHPVSVTFASGFSYATGFNDAVLAVCHDIIDGMHVMTGGTATGTHGVYTGTATVTNIA